MIANGYNKTVNTAVTAKDHSMEDSDYGSIAKEFNR